MYQSDALVRALWLTDNYLIDSHIEAKNLKACMEKFRFSDERIASNSIDSS